MLTRCHEALLVISGPSLSQLHSQADLLHRAGSRPLAEPVNSHQVTSESPPGDSPSSYKEHAQTAGKAPLA